MVNSLCLAQINKLFSSLSFSDKSEPPETKSEVFLVLNNDKDKKCWNLENGLKFKAEDIVDKGLFPEPFDLIKGKVEASFVKQVIPSRKSKIVGTVSKSPSKNDYIGKINDNTFFNAQNFLHKNFRIGDLVECCVVETKYESFLWRAISVEIIQKHSFFYTSPSNHKSSKNTDLATKKTLESLQPALVEKNLSFLEPENLENFVKTGSIFTKYPELLEDLCEKNYVIRFSALLYISEITEKNKINAKKVHNVKLKPLEGSEDTFKLKCANLISQCGTIRNKENIKISKYGCSKKTHVYFGSVEEIDKSTETIHVKLENKNLDTLKPTDKFLMKFCFNRITFKRAHFGMNLSYYDRKDLLFPKQENRKEKCVNREAEKKFKFYNTNLNERQRVAVENIQSSCSKNAYILIGPPGTGKTVTLTELIVQLLRKDPRSRLLVCAPSNNAVDNLCLKLLESKQADGLFTRFNSATRPKDQLPKELLVCSWGKVEEDGRNEETNYNDIFKYFMF